MKHIRWQVLIAVVGIAFLSVVLGFLALSTTFVERPDFGGTYTEGVAGSPKSINPIFSEYNDVDRDLTTLIFSGLTQADVNGTLQPDLASQWSISPDGLIYTFTLRADVRWQDGARFSADDVLYTIHSVQDPEYKGPPDLAGFWRTVAVTQIDSATIRFQLTQAYAPFLNYTTIGILPYHLLKDVAPGDLAQNGFNRHPVGTGPFQLTEITSDHVLLDANPHYYGTRPFLSRIRFKFYPDDESVFSAYTHEEVEGISRILPAYLPKARSLDQLTLYNARLSGYSLVLLNLDKAPFQDKQVRQALLYAIDRQHLINDVLQGQGLLAASPIEPGTWAYDDAISPYPFDVDKAKALLDSAGWKDVNADGVREKNQTALSFTLTTTDDPVRAALANEIAKNWQAIGVKATVVQVPGSRLVQDILRPRQFDAVLYEWRTLSNDPDQYENWHETQIPSGTTAQGQNYSGLSDRDISEALESARKINDQGKRAELYHSFQELFADRVPALLLFYPVYTYGVDARVHGIQLAPMIMPSDRFRNIQQWYLKTKRVASNASQVGPTATARSTPIAATPIPPPPTAPPVAPPTSAPAPTTTPAPATPPSTPGQCADLSAVISYPTMDSTVSGLVEIRGSASRPNMTYWKLEYRSDSSQAYVSLYRSDQPATNSTLSLWSTKTVPNGIYWLQLSVVDNTGNFGTPCQVRVNVSN